ncbi:MAG: single-stranded-DNA-specific exonuclease RecJ [Clostridia bacterium]|nr:single-stranded-DNA-specific exonuclease RecJ [Clostridia bacterium]
MIVCKNDYSNEQLNIINSLANEFNLSENLVKILFGRGIDTAEKISSFLNPGKHNFISPFLLSGMRDAVERITLARDMGETVVVFGDYDADGICASALLTNALRDFGIATVYTVIPERSNGYGLTHALVEEMLERCEPDLVITVDCGISCKDEVCFIEDVGVDVIVTDHHELPDELPDCTVINCKIKEQDYPFDCLCGAGVAYKLASALLGEKADKYLDLVTIATIADSMILLGENRDIVFEGLKLIKKGKNPAIKRLIEISNLREITSTGLAFTVAPRINAAGRMGNANCALELLLENDYAKIDDYCNRLNEYNVERQTECDKLLKSAKAKIESEGLGERVIVLADDSWNGGLVGIVAAKLVEEYGRPVVLFTKTDDFYHGSARSIESINIFQAVNNCKNLLIDFGGHAQAAGITIKGENLSEFTKALSNYIESNYDDEVFIPRIEVDEIISERFSIDFAKELQLLEPFGTGNRKPIFSIDVTNINASPLKPDSTHIGFRTEFIDLLYFNGIKHLDILNSPAQKSIVFEANLSVFNGKQSLKGYVKNFEYKVINGERLKLDCFKQNLLSVFNSIKSCECYDNEVIAKLIEKYKGDKSTVFAVSDIENLRKYHLGKINCSLYQPQGKNITAELVISPIDCETASVQRVIYLDKPLGNFARIGNATNYCAANYLAFSNVKLSTSREIFAEVFKLLRFNRFYGKSSVDVALGINHESISQEQIIFCLEVFIELKIFSFVSGTLQYDSKVKADLSSSVVYNSVLNK